jgi:Fe-S-cluster containining protein
MQLSSRDIERLERLGYASRDFTTTRRGFRTLRNVDGVCYFYDAENKSCKVYEKRPEGCRYYPVMYCLDEGKPIIDEETCNKTYTITKGELKKITPRLTRLIKRILEDLRSRNTNLARGKEKSEWNE